MNEYLAGGRKDIYKQDHWVFRPAESWTIYVHQFLRYLHGEGFDKVPYPIGIDKDGMEKITYVQGTVYNELLPEEVKSDVALISFCHLIKQFHDIGEKYVKNLSGQEKWMLTTQTPIETMCHGDLAPYNIAMEGNEAVGIIDFDTLHPGSRMWDIAYAIYRWIPLMSPDNIENFGDEKDKHRRLDLFVKTYGLEKTNYPDIIESVIQRLSYLISFMKSEADNGNATFIQHIEEGHLALYQRDLDYIVLNWLK